MLHSGFLKSVGRFPHRPALTVSGETLTYTQLYERAAALAAALARRAEASPHAAGDRIVEAAPAAAGDAAGVATPEASAVSPPDATPGPAPPFTAVLASRSVTAYTGVLAALLRGHGYVPLNPAFPPERTRTMLERSGARALIVDGRSEAQLDAVLSGLDRDLTILLPERDDVREWSSGWPRHVFLGRRDVALPADWRPCEVSRAAPAYLLFTSGSTGQPKGVVVAHGNTANYLEFIAERFAVTETDRFSQLFDLTFDLSVSDLFLAWSRGACVHVPSARAVLNPGRYLQEADLTVWFSVPSTPIFMRRLGSLKPGAYPSLRVSLFCGEALPIDVARAWAAAAPHSVVENLYGPTELTIACTYYRWDPAVSPAQSAFGIVPIGWPFPHMTALVVDEALREVPPGEAGELLMAGPQVAIGYWDEPETTARAFLVPPGKTERYYRTGDRVVRPAGEGPMTYLGRVDHQVKILGHRVELAEVEAVVRELSGFDAVVAVAWPVTPGGAGGVEVFLQGNGQPAADLKERVAARLPAYMVPRRFHTLERLPLSPNGKYDRRRLLERLEGMA